MTPIEVFLQLVAMFALAFLATWNGIVDIPDSLADMEDPPELWGAS